ncbi:MAG: NACHT domain-containing protein [Moorea sp. SIO1G6]|uniref:NACHT domain-containing protein n=1 Tax=Moorena sp. SIO1G6 TaxID=2607840 RepID=UPI0013BFF198|nr:NACHT domain-containing protein [Moorena sp. SIO1G6]NET67481.1 NACHT domain-containing protein [Moorena sp. SIO1G6]
MNLAELLTNPNVLKLLLLVLLGIFTCIVGLLINRFEEQNTRLRKIIVIALCTIYGVLGAVGGHLVFKPSAEQNPQWFQQVYWILGIGYLFALPTIGYLLKTTISRKIPKANLQRWRKDLLGAMAAEVNIRLDDSLHNDNLIKLVMADQREQVGRPEKITVNPSNSRSLWEGLLKFFRVTKESEAGQKVIEVFNQDDIAGKLLILGAPGSGKTTMLLDLAKDLITRAQQQPDQPIPIIAELSDWKDNKQPIDQWLAAHLKFRYNLPEAITQEWINTGQLLPLLDGLDELGLERQKLCVQQLNQFVKHVPQIVVCCRKEEYEADKQIQDMRGAVCLQPLSDEQIEAYLEAYLNGFKGRLWPGIKQDSEGLLELARMPLFLHLICRTYPDGLKRVGRHFLGINFKDPKAKEDYQNECRQKLFEAYIDRKLEENHDRRGYSEEETRRWLGWLAKQLKERKQTEFLIEKMQPDMLNSSIENRLYKLILVIILVIIFGIIIGIIGVLAYGLLFGIIFGIIMGLAYGRLFGLRNDKIKLYETIIFSWEEIKKIIKLMTEHTESLIKLFIFSGLSFWLILLIYGRIEVLNEVLIILLIILLILVLLGSLLQLREEEVKTRNKPNQGIKESAKNTVIISIIIFTVTLLSLVLLTLVSPQNIEPVSMLICASGMAMLFGFLVAGIPVIQHFVLRLILWRSGSIPWDYAHFLSYATERRLIKQVGGRYRFIHDLLREHFATT